MSAEPWKLTLPCTRAEAESLAGEVEELTALASPPVLVATEPDPAQPDRWQLDAYFEGKPSRDVLRIVSRLVPSAREKEPRAKPLPPADWVTLSQAGLEPVEAGRFRVRTPDHLPVADMVDLVIPAGLAFGTGQHATTSGCLETLDGLKRRGERFRDILDLGTGTGLLAFGAMKLWRQARATASDIDPLSVDVVRENAALNGVRTGRLAGALHLVVADGLNDSELVRRAPYDLVIANILAMPLIEMAATIAASVSGSGSLILAGLLDTQERDVVRAYRAQGMRAVRSTGGEWPTLLLRKR